MSGFRQGGDVTLHRPIVGRWSGRQRRRDRVDDAIAVRLAKITYHSRQWAIVHRERHFVVEDDEQLETIAARRRGRAESLQVLDRPPHVQAGHRCLVIRIRDQFLDRAGIDGERRNSLREPADDDADICHGMLLISANAADMVVTIGRWRRR